MKMEWKEKTYDNTLNEMRVFFGKRTPNYGLK